MSDDGLPDPPAALAVTWSQVDGPGEVVFANPNAVGTTATFPLAGVYTLTYTATDEAGNTATATCTVTVADTTAPEITLLGTSTVVQAEGTPYVDAGASAHDTVDGAVPVIASGTVGSAPGTYTLINAPGGLTGTFASVTDLDAYVSVNGNGLTYDYATGAVGPVVPLAIPAGRYQLAQFLRDQPRLFRDLVAAKFIHQRCRFGK